MFGGINMYTVYLVLNTGGIKYRDQKKRVTSIRVF